MGILMKMGESRAIKKLLKHYYHYWFPVMGTLNSIRQGKWKLQ